MKEDKSKLNKFTIFWLAIGLSLPLCLAKDSSQTQKKTTQHGTTAAAMQKDCRLSKLVKAEIKSSAGEKLGDVEDFIINPKSGKIDMVILGSGGFLNLGERYIAVPWDKVSSTSESEVTLSLPKQELQTAPTLDKDLSSLKDPEFISKVYSYFGEPLNVGSGETPGGKLHGGSQSSAKMENPK